MKFRIKYADQVVGLFIVISLVALVAIVVLLGLNQRWFAKNFVFKTQFKSGGGLSVGMPITMKGFQIGQVERIHLNEDDMVDVEFAIFDTYYDKVKEHSVVELSVSPIGLGGGLFFHPGKGAELLPEGSFIPRLSSDEGQAIYEQELADIPPKDDTITQLLAGINPLLENVNKMVVSLNRTLQEVNRAMIGQSTGPVGTMLLDAASAVASVNGLVSDVRAIINDVVAQVNGIIEQTGGVMVDVGAIAKNLEQTTAALADPTGLIPRLLDPKGSIATILDDGNALYNSIESTLAMVTETMANLEAISSSLLAEMPKIATILNQSKEALQVAQDVLTGLKNNPLLSGGIPERQDQQSVYTSIREGEF
jgi:phospholipid/cholesterol/gamma-HCH transport system substrate-binding protein